MKKPKLMVIGLDSISLTLLDKFAACTPNIRRLMRGGTSGRALPCFPVYTPTNWAALSTGADPGATAAAAWRNECAGRELSTFDRRAIPCDTIFDSAARAGLTTLAISYPSAHPTASPRNMVLAPLDRGLVSNSLVPGRIIEAPPGKDAAFEFDLLQTPAALSGASAAKAAGATEDGAEAASGAKRRASAGKVRARIRRTGRAAWALCISPAGEPVYELQDGRWSEPIRVDIAAPGRPGRCTVRVMVFDAGRRIAISEAYDVGALGKPAALAQKVLNRLDPPVEHSVFYTAMSDLFAKGVEDKAITDMTRRDMTAQADWIVAAAAMVQKARPFDVFYLHHHYPDSVLHHCLSAAEGLRPYTPKQHRLAREAIAMCLRICDRLVGGLMRLAGPKTTVLLVSDHGNVSNRYSCSLLRRLVETGLTRLDSHGKPDRARSQAWPDRVGTWVAVNAKAGTQRYARIQEKVIDALLDWRGKDGKRVVALALRRKDSHVLGYYGQECSDVTFHFNSGFSWFGSPDRSVHEDTHGANHGPQMPVTFSKLSDNLAFFVLKGPRFAAAHRADEQKGYVRLVDMVPTICAASGVPAPRDATGAVRHDLER
ncbi:MAG: alkaline phosphatase family protein [Phycisphaerae bacterium]